MQYRILILDSETKPYEYVNLVVSIIDSEDNVLFNKMYVNDEKLVYTNAYNISNNPFLGIWSLKVQVDEHPETTCKDFEVKEYILPRFQAFIETKEFVRITDRKIIVSIYAKYNFGQFVKGKAKVTVKVFDSKYPTDLAIQKQVQLSNILQKKDHSFDIKSDLHLTSASRDIYVDIEVEFEEELTKKKMKAEKRVTIKEQGKFLIEVIRPQLKLKPGFPYEFRVLVRNPDNSLVSSNNKLEVKAQFYYSSEKCALNVSAIGTTEIAESYESKGLKNGVANLSFDIAANTSGMTITFKYFDSEKIINVLRFPSKTRDYLKAEVNDRKM